MQVLRRKVRGKRLALNQIVARVIEYERSEGRQAIKVSDTVEIRENRKGIVHATVKGLLIANRPPDCYFLMSDNSVIRVTNIYKRNSQVNFTYKKFKNPVSVSHYPIDSRKLGIYKLSESLTESFTGSLDCLKRKCVVLPLSNHSFISIPFSENI